jgi:SAM-dependent methyltransferase
MRRRREALRAREAWAMGRRAPLAALSSSQTLMVAANPRVDRIVDLLGLGPGRRYLDVGCGTAALAHVVAARAGMVERPVTADIAPVPGPIDVVAWPEQLPFRDASFEAITSLYFIRRFDDEVVNGFARELRRVLAPGGAALVMEFAPVESGLLNRVHAKVVSAGCGKVDLRGWGRLMSLFAEVGFDAIDLVNVGPFLVPPIPRVGVLLRRASSE